MMTNVTMMMSHHIGTLGLMSSTLYSLAEWYVHQRPTVALQVLADMTSQ